MLKPAIHGDARCMDRVGTFIDRIQIVERFIAVHDLARPVVIYGLCGSAVWMEELGGGGWQGGKSMVVAAAIFALSIFIFQLSPHYMVKNHQVSLFYY